MLAYADSVEAGEVLACDALTKAVARFRADWKAASKKGAKWIFDAEAADKIVRNIERLVHFEDPFTGQPIILEPWQCFQVCQLYGWKSRATGLRRFKKVLWFFARKQGKTILASSIALNETATRAGIEAYALATKQLVSNKSFKNIERFVKANPALRRMFKIHKSPKSVECPETASVFLPLSSDSDLDGLNPSVAIIDELAAQDNAEAYSNLTSGMGTRPERLTIIISTAAASSDNPLMPEYEYAKRILDGSTEDDELLVGIYEYDKGDRWDDLSKLQKSCPNLGVTTDLEFYEGELKKARVIPRAALEYKTKYCNLWQSASEVWIPDGLWARSSRAAKKYHKDTAPDRLAGLPCAFGIDFSNFWDWTAYSRYYWIADLDKYVARHRFYIPADKLDEKAAIENPALREWVSQGLVVATPGEKIDHAYLYRDLEEDLGASECIAIAYDPARAGDFERTYEGRWPIVPFSQKVANFGPAAKAWEEAIVSSQILDDSPIMRWMVSCAIRKIYADSGRYQISKQGTGKYGKRIDGVMTSIMAHAVLRAHVLELTKPRAPVFDLSQIRF